MKWYGNSQLSMLSLQICSSWGYLLNFMAQVRTRVSLGGKQSVIKGYVRGTGHLNALLASLTWPCTWFSCCCTARCSGLEWSSVGRSPGKRDNHHTRNYHMWNFIFWHGKNRRNFYPTWLWLEPVLHFWRMSQVSKCCEAIPQVVTDTHCI